MLRTLVLLLCAATPAEPEPAWLASFRTPALVSWVGESKPAVLVAAAGGPSSEGAAAALEIALRESGAVQVAMDDAALGEIADKADLAIVASSASLPINRVAVVRVFAAAAGSPPTAAVTLYDLRGAGQGSFVVTAGTPLPARLVSAPEGQAAGSIPEQVPAVAGPQVEPLSVGALARIDRRPDESSLQTYERNYIGFKDNMVVTIDSGRVVSNWLTMYRGRYHEKLEGLAFYETIGRTDLAERYTSRRALRFGFMAGGVAVAAGGAGLIAWGLTGNCRMVEAETGACLERDTRPVVAGGILVGTGILTALVASAFNPHPIDGPQLRELADRYNRSLAASLGVEAPRASRGLRFDAFAARGQGGVSVAGEF